MDGSHFVLLLLIVADDIDDFTESGLDRVIDPLLQPFAARVGLV